MGLLFFLMLVFGLPVFCLTLFALIDRALINKCLPYSYSEIKIGIGKCLEQYNCTIYAVGEKSLSKDKYLISKNPNAKLKIFETCIILHSGSRALIIKDYSCLHYSSSPVIYGKTLNISMKDIPEISVFLIIRFSTVASSLS